MSGRHGINRTRHVTCQHCGKAFTSNHAQQRFCGTPCWKASKRKAQETVSCVMCGAVTAKVKWSQVTCMSPECRRTYASRAALVRNRPKRQAARAIPFKCRDCGRTTVRGESGRFRYCERCTTKTHRYSVGNTHRQRARRWGGAIGQVNPLRVFIRDRWKCQICGVSTPRRLKGKGMPTSPEVDHIVPLRRGGDHTYDNVQLACRTCNRSKGDRRMSGQSRLPFEQIVRPRATWPELAARLRAMMATVSLSRDERDKIGHSLRNIRPDYEVTRRIREIMTSALEWS